MATSVVIPAKDAATLLPDCLRAIRDQLDPAIGDRLVVVDDASTDQTAEVARSLGAEVIGMSSSVGPYEARNRAVAVSDADVIIFADTRSRVRPGWLDAHRALLRKPGVSLSCTNVRVSSGTSVAERISSVVNMFDLENYAGTAGRLDYFPTCNLGVDRAAFLAVGGFRAVRSGGDADLCWRVQRAGGRLGIDNRVLMDWVPRTSMRALFEQSFRYGRGHAVLVRDEPPAVRDKPLSDDSVTNESVPVSRLDRLRRRLADNDGDAVAVAGSYALVLPLVAGRLAARLGR